MFAVASALIPLRPIWPACWSARLLAGLASGTFIPLTIGFVVCKPQAGVCGRTASRPTALNLELSLNVPAVARGLVHRHLSWHWIFWQGTLLALPMLAAIYFGMPRQPVHREALRDADFWGMFYAAAGFSMLYAALDQGNRLDWLNSGLICGLLLAAAVLIVAFIVQI